MTRAMDQPLRYGGWKLAVAVGSLIAVAVAGLVVGGEWGHVARGAWQVVPFTVLALLAYVGMERRWARVLTLVGLAVIILGAGWATVSGTCAVTDRSLRVAVRKLALVRGIGVAILLAATGFLPRMRRALARMLPLDPHSFVQTVALVTVVALTLMSFVPLLVLSAPPLLSPVVTIFVQEEDLAEGRGHGGRLLDALYGLVWLVPAAVMAVGYGVHRNFREALERLGLQRPTGRQIRAGLGVAVVLVIGLRGLSAGVDWLWATRGWPQTDTETFSQLLAHVFSPWGALVIGVVAGVSEELAVRGVLQPRLGLWLSNLFFTGLHAWQYHWDALLIVFVLGLVCGLVRQQANTTLSAIVHGTYDFLLIMAVVLPIPWFAE